MPPSAHSLLWLHQFKITLVHVEPPVWRRIQVPDCTLNELHEHIQTAMGWTNSHLHEFMIDGRRYGDPELLDEGGGDRNFIDSTEIRVSQLMASERHGFQFDYLYDFGANWQHEIVYEWAPPAEPDGLYPRCIEGAGACPRDDCGASAKFSSLAATRKMIRGLPDWREAK